MADAASRPGDLWQRALADGLIRIGLTRPAVDALGGEVTYVGLPTVGAIIEVGGPFAEVESSKATVELPAPMSCEVVEVNEPLADSPADLTDDPEGAGWIAVVRRVGE